jgi:hypothetical protein
MNTKLLMILGGGVLLYLWSQSQSKPQSAAGSAGGGATPTPRPQPPASVPTPPAVSAAGYQATMQKIQAYIMASGVSDTYLHGQQTPDVWNWYAMQVLTGWVAPAPEDMFPNTSDAHKAVDFATWWAAVQPFLPKGLSGMPWPRSNYFAYGGWLA